MFGRNVKKVSERLAKKTRKRKNISIWTCMSPGKLGNWVVMI